MSNHEDKSRLIDADEPTLVDTKKKMTTLHWVGVAVLIALLMLGLNSRFLFQSKKQKVATPAAVLDVESDALHTSLPKPKAQVPVTPVISADSITPKPAANDEESEGVMAYLKSRARQASPAEKLRALQKINARKIELSQLKLMRDSSVLSGLGVGENPEANASNGAKAAISTDNANVAFLNQVGNQSSGEEEARLMGDLRFRIAQGKVIRGVIESAINSDLPGLIRAHVTENVYGDQGDVILIPNGSRLIGQYRSGNMKAGQTRVYIVWTRLIEPNGVTVNLDSPGNDSLGRAGMTGQVDKHFIERFGSSFLMSIISVGAATYGVSVNDQFNSRSAYRQGLSNSFAKMANDELEQNLSIQNTIRIHQGTPMNIIVAKDISFEQVLQSGGLL